MVKGLSNTRKGGRCGVDDREIVELFWARDQCGLEELSKKYGPYCAVIARRLLGADADAEECVNDVWLAAWRSIPPQRPERLGTYLGKLTRRLCLTRLEHDRALKRGGGETELSMEELSECLPGGEGVEGRLEAERLSRAISAYLRTLTDAKRRVFVLRYWYAIPVQEIAARFGYSVTKTSNMLARVRRGLREHLVKEDFINE